LVIKQSIVLVFAGTVIGLALALALTRVMSSLLYGVSATDLKTFVVPPLVFGGIALIASYFPARRAVSVDPAVALRSE
jgi:ABC-type antimicrobial peptide transport system permease subunit